MQSTWRQNIQIPDPNDLLDLLSLKSLILRRVRQLLFNETELVQGSDVISDYADLLSCGPW